MVIAINTGTLFCRFRYGSLSEAILSRAETRCVSNNEIHSFHFLEVLASVFDLSNSIQTLLYDFCFSFNSLQRARKDSSSLSSLFVCFSKVSSSLSSVSIWFSTEGGRCILESDNTELNNNKVNFFIILYLEGVISGVVGVQIVSGKSNSGLAKQGEQTNKRNKISDFIIPFIKAPREGTRPSGVSQRSTI